MGFARERLGAWRDIMSYKPGGRARVPQALLAGNKRRSERSSRCAAWAALDLTGAKQPKPNTPQPSRNHMPTLSTYNLTAAQLPTRQHPPAPRQ